MKISKIIHFGIALSLLGSIVLCSEAYAIKTNSVQFACRRSRGLNELVAGKSYLPEELKARGYSVNKITLEGIKDSEILTRAEEQVSYYEVVKDDQPLGWLEYIASKGGELLDRAKIEERYLWAVKDHALYDSILARDNFKDDEHRLRVDDGRHMAHQKAILLGSIIGKDRQAVELDIIAARNVKVQEIDRGHFVLTYLPNGNIALEVNYLTWIGHMYYQAQHPVISVIADVLSEFYKNSPDITSQVKALAPRPMPDGTMRIIPKEARFEFPQDKLPIVLAHLEFLCAYINKTEGSTLFEDFSSIPFVNTATDTYRNVCDKLMAALSDAVAQGKLQAPDFETAGISMLGQKGYNLYRIKEISIPVPDFMLKTTKEEVSAADVESAFNGRLGVYRNGTGEIVDLLVSVRSSPAVSMPGILNTVLNVGLTEEGVELLAQKYGRRFAYEAYASFLRSFGVGVFGINEKSFGSIPSNLDEEGALGIVGRYKTLIRESGFEIPQDPAKQLEMAIKAVEESWNSQRANTYRFYQDITDDTGMKVIIEKMKFGNLNENSGSFVLFTRHPVTGEKGLYVEYAQRSQGDELVGGWVNPVPLEESGLEQDIIDEIKLYAERIENEFGYVQDIEGVVEDGKVWIVQTRDARLSPEAEVKALVDLVEEGVITKEEALLRAGDLGELEKRLSHTRIDPSTAERPIAEGLGASSGAIVGVIALTKEKAEEYKSQGLSVILIREEVSPSDLGMMRMADGLLTHIGGMLSHAAILGRGIDLPTIAGCEAIEIDALGGAVAIAGSTFKEGDYITIDGTNGRVYAGRIPLVTPPETNPYLEIIRGWIIEQ